MPNKKPVLMIDCQVFQTQAWHRGMGKYSHNFLNAVFASNDVKQYDKIVFLLNKNLPLEEDAESYLAEIYTSAERKYLDLAILKNKKIKDFQDVNKKTIQSYIDQSFTDETVHFMILSLFLGEDTCIVFPDSVKKILLFYDLIPFLYAERYSLRIPYDDYLANFKTIFEADLLLAISQTVADDLTIYLGISDKKIRSIDGAPIDRTRLTAEMPEGDFGENFILMPSGDEIRKNNLRAVQGFEQFNARSGNKYKLVMTSFFSPNTLDELKSISNNLIFTGNISESQLQWLYEEADLILFASEYEGLGLPVLEAMTVGKRIACSDIPVFREISEDALYYFNHMDPTAIAAGIAHAINDDNFVRMQAAYTKILKTYTWFESARKFFEATSILNKPAVTSKPANSKPKVAIFTPHPGGFSAIGKVVAESHAVLSEEFEIDYYVDFGLYHREVRPDFLSSIARCLPATEFNVKAYADYDAVIYHVGNSDYHLETIKNALYLPGYIIFHDTHLEGAYERLEIDGYMTPNRIKLEKTLNTMVKSQKSSYLTSLAHNQLGILCHSKYALKTINDVLGKASVSQGLLQLPVGVPMRTLPKGNDDKLRVCFAGIFADVKGLSVIEQVARNYDAECEITVFGFDFAQPDSLNRLKEFPNVQIIANPTDFGFQTLLMKQDLLVNYRLKYRGETSLTTLEAMRFGVVPIVRNIGWYKELAQDTVIKLDSIDSVVKCIDDLFIDREKLRRISANAKKYVGNNFSHEEYTQQVQSFIAGANDQNLKNTQKETMLKAGNSVLDILRVI